MSATGETPRQIAERYLAMVAGRDRRAVIWENLLEAAIKAGQTTPAFKPEGEWDYYRSQWEDIYGHTGQGEYRVRLNNGDRYTKMMRISEDQARRILEMLSSEAGA